MVIAFENPSSVGSPERLLGQRCCGADELVSTIGDHEQIDKYFFGKRYSKDLTIVFTAFVNQWQYMLNISFKGLGAMWNCRQTLFAQHTGTRILRIQSPITDGEREN